MALILQLDIPKTFLEKKMEPLKAKIKGGINVEIAMWWICPEWASEKEESQKGRLFANIKNVDKTSLDKKVDVYIQSRKVGRKMLATDEIIQIEPGEDRHINLGRHCILKPHCFSRKDEKNEQVFCISSDIIFHFSENNMVVATADEKK